MKPSTRIFSSLITAILLVVSLLGAMPVSTVHAAAVTYIVNNLNDVNDGTCDSTHCSLREAILLSNANINLGTETDIIQFSVSGTITPAPGVVLPNIKGNLLIDGTGVKIALNGDNVRRVLYIDSGTVTLKNLTIQNGNVVGKPYPVGGGVFVNGGAIVTVSSSTFTGNLALNGGAIANNGTLTISNSTFYNNQAAFGGGAFNEGTLSIYNSTFSGNSASTGGGAVYNNAGRTMNLGNTILANSTAGGDCGNAGTIGSNVQNLVMDNTCSPIIDGDPQLMALADNGGYTQTMALLNASPARDAGDATVCTTPPVSSVDQRGAARGTQCDIGAYEAAGISTLDIYPNPLNFGEQAIGTTSLAREVTVTYTGTGSINLGTLLITGEFAFLGYNNCNSATLNATTSTCTFRVTFSPLTVGPKTGSVTINSSGGSLLGTLLLTGTGTDPKVSLSTTSLILAKTYVDTTSPSKTVTITNSGTGLLVLGEFFTSGDFILHSNTCQGAKLPALGTCTFKVAFSPLSPGIHTGEVIIKSNAASSSIPPGDRVALRGVTLEGTQLLKMGSFDLVETPIFWVVSATPGTLVRIRDCVVFRSPFCSAKFTGARTNPILSASQMVYHSGAAGDKFLISLATRASRVPLGGLFQLQVRFYGPTGLVGAPTILFSSGTRAFQASSTTFTAPAAYTRIMYSFVFQKSSGIAWFDDAMLILLP